MRQRVRQLGHMQFRHVIKQARAERLPTIVGFCGAVVNLDNLNPRARITVCSVCKRIARELQTGQSGGEA